MIAISASLAQRPGHGGHAWVFLQYLLGFRRLGWDVLFLDELQPEMCVDERGNRCDFRESWNLRYFVDVMKRFGLEHCYSLSYCGGEKVLGLSRSQVVQKLKRSAFLLNVMGFLTDDELLSAARRRVFLDIDPGFGQMWRDLGHADIFAGHDDFVTIGQNIGSEKCRVPLCDLTWITTLPPIVLEHWPVVAPSPTAALTSIVSWRGPFGPIEHRGRTYGLRVHEFRKFVTLPQVTDQAFEIALDIHPDEKRDIQLLDSNFWTRVNPRIAAGTPADYQQFITASKAEFMVAKNLYVRTHGGWFSDRSACYLASGRPVLAQDTGIAGLLPIGNGLLTFSTLEEAVAGVTSINRDYSLHCRAARAIAESCFDSDKVLTRLLTNLGVN